MKEKMKMMGPEEEKLGWCLECLERRIHIDFQQPQQDDDQPLFCHGLPAATSAVLQVPNPNVTGSSRFILSLLQPNHPFSSYIDDCISVDGRADHPPGSIIRAVAPLARASSTCSYSLLQQVAADFSSGALEDQILRPNHLSNPLLLASSASPFRHPNFVPLLALLRSSSSLYSLIPHTPHTLQSLLHFSPGALSSAWHITFLFYQLLSAVTYLHSLGVSHLHISPSNIMLTDSCWLWLHIWGQASPLPASTAHSCPCQGLYSELKLSTPLDWPTLFHSWWKGELSNFDYLVVLSRLAGRRWGDHAFHIVMPWVIDFSVKPDNNSDLGWRDLSKSKWRLAKGDEQLDFTYSTSEVPHHLSDECLSDLAVCSYKARRLPLSVLRLAVRSVYEPNEYPSSMQRLYQWTPDECIPDFYCDPSIFYSIHPGMADLAVPTWAASPEDFIKIHRDSLESERVSQHLHHWIDITFGYKMSGEAAFDAKNVMLPSSELTTLRSVGRRQLFTQPHPPRQHPSGKKNSTIPISAKDACHLHEAEGGSLLSETSYLSRLEEAFAFSEHATHLSPQFGCDQANCSNEISYNKESASKVYERSIFMPPENHPGNGVPSEVKLSHLIDQMELYSSNSMDYQELLLWRNRSVYSPFKTEDCGKDIFAVGCVLAEICLMRPIFSSTTLAAYTESGIMPALIEELPPHTRVIVEACIHTDWTRRPSAKSILESPYFSSTVRSCYLFIAPLQFLTGDGARLQYAANFAKQGTLKAMGTYAAEMCAPYCLPLVVRPQSDTEAEWAYELLREFIRCLNPQAVKSLVLPAIQKILQTTGSSHLKVLLLQGSFVQDIWSLIGKRVYLETLHPVVISNLSCASHKSSAASASVLLICTSEELGVPVTINQTILPLIHCFGKGLCSDGIEALVRIGGLFGDTFVVKQMLPLLKRVIRSCIDVSLMNKAEPVQSWSSLALIDCLTTVDGLVASLPGELVLKELIEDGGCLHVTVLMQTNLDVPVLQVAASTLVAVCQRIGPDLTASHVLPQLKELFYDLAFSEEAALGSGHVGKTLSRSKLFGEAQIESRIDLVSLLYPSFASLLGIEKLRQSCATWLLLEQYLFHYHSWKWEHTGEPFRGGPESIASRRPSFKKMSASEYNPAKLLLNGVGWSIPQSQGSRAAKILTPRRQFGVTHQNLVESHMATSTLSHREPWFWFPTPADSWEGLDFVGRLGNLKDELPWKIKASVIYSIKAHHGALRSLAVSEDECTVYTAGVGPGFKGTVHRWELSRINCVSGYYGHEEVVNDICLLSSNGRVASCDGTIHVWNSRTGKAVSAFTETSDGPMHLVTPLSSPSKFSADNSNTLNSNTLLTSTFDGSLYTCMHHLGFSKKIIAGTGNGSIRFIDVSQGQKLHLWKGEITEPAFPSLVSTICSCESDKSPADISSISPSWIAVGLSSGHCRLFDSRSGNLITSWRAHDGYVTKLAAPDRHLLVSSSFDRTVRIWDLRRNLPMQTSVFKGHADGVSDFSVWGQDVISISRNKIGISSLWKAAQQDGGQQQQITPQKLHFADNGTKNLSVLTSIRILPFSRAFVVGTEDGYLRICC